MQICRLPILSFLALALPALASSALAAEIGSAVRVTPSVTGTSGGALAAGSPVYQDEVIRSGASGSAELVLRDNTRLAVGSNSSVKLDQFVYAGGQRASSVVLGLAKGSFRFVTGASAKKAYRIDTPLASIGVRGTTLDIGVSSRRVAVTLRHGAADVCVRGRGCVPLNGIGQTLTVNADGSVSIGRRGGINPANGTHGNNYPARTYSNPRGTQVRPSAE